MRVTMIAVIAAMCLSCASASPRKTQPDPHAAVQPGDVRGCLAYWQSSTDSFIYEPFIKVADKETPGEDGQVEIWGFRTWNLEPPDREGLTHPVNVPEALFIPLDQLKVVGRKSTRCPPSYSGGDSIAGADKQKP